VKASNIFIIILTVLLCKAPLPVRLRALSQSTDYHAQQDVHLHVPVKQPPCAGEAIPSRCPVADAAHCEYVDIVTIHDRADSVFEYAQIARMRSSENRLLSNGI